jgi:hypothetical protein
MAAVARKMCVATLARSSARETDRSITFFATYSVRRCGSGGNMEKDAQ